MGWRALACRHSFSPFSVKKRHPRLELMDGETCGDFGAFVMKVPSCRYMGNLGKLA
jgi:hypothetical protein